MSSQDTQNYELSGSVYKEKHTNFYIRAHDLSLR